MELLDVNFGIAKKCLTFFVRSFSNIYLFCFSFMISFARAQAKEKSHHYFKMLILTPKGTNTSITYAGIYVNCARIRCQSQYLQHVLWRLQFFFSVGVVE